jgi:hypothetical protein
MNVGRTVGRTGQQLHSWWLTVEQRLAVDGELTVTEDPADPGYRRFDLEAPGHGLATEATFRYEEWHERRRSRWVVREYVYHSLDRLMGGEMGYHWHPLHRADPAGGPVHHVVCRPSGGESGHYRSYHVSLLEAHEALYRRYAAAERIDCAGFLPLW